MVAFSSNFLFTNHAHVENHNCVVDTHFRFYVYIIISIKSAIYIVDSSLHWIVLQLKLTFTLVLRGSAKLKGRN